jgi:hypothetical protein
VSIELPASLESTIRAYAAAERLSAEDAVLRLIEAGLKIEEEHRALARDSSRHRPSYSSLFGAAKTGATYGTPEAVDRYIAELRNEW